MLRHAYKLLQRTWSDNRGKAAVSVIGILILSVHGCGNGDREAGEPGAEKPQVNQAPNVINQPYVLVPVPQDSWMMGRQPQAQAQRPAPVWRDSHPEVAPPPARRLESVNPWQPGVEQSQGTIGGTGNPWASGATRRPQPAAPQFRPLDEDGRKPYEPARPAPVVPVAPYDRIQGSSQHPGMQPYPSAPGYGYPPAYGYPGYATTPYAYPAPGW